jgi:hypothetical protein
VPAPRWDGPLRRDGVAVGAALEVVFCALLAVVRARERAARRPTAAPYDQARADAGLDPAAALRFVLTYLLVACILAVAGVLLANLSLHMFSGVKPAQLPTAVFPSRKPAPTPPPVTGRHFSLPLAAIGYALLVIAVAAAVVLSIWWSSRLVRAAAPAPAIVADTTEEELREAVAEGQAALAALEDDRAAIIACYVAMERRLAERGTARGVADTPDELLARAVAAGTVRGVAAGRLTSLFYEARFSTHPLAGGQRDAASAALDELAAELKGKPAPEPAQGAVREPAPGPSGGEPT